MDKNISRLRRAKKTRAHIRTLAVARLSVHRSSQHLYAQVFTADGKVVAVANTLQDDVIAGVKGTKNKAAAAQFARWNRQGKVVLAGLSRRRAAEAALYRTMA